MAGNLNWKKVRSHFDRLFYYICSFDDRSWKFVFAFSWTTVCKDLCSLFFLYLFWIKNREIINWGWNLIRYWSALENLNHRSATAGASPPKNLFHSMCLRFCHVLERESTLKKKKKHLHSWNMWNKIILNSQYTKFCRYGKGLRRERMGIFVQIILFYPWYLTDFDRSSPICKHGGLLFL